MPRSAGQKLGKFTIVGPLGAGGMGEVYRAHDEDLNRDVAIKILSEDLASDPEALGRLGTEAKALAALQHPAVASLYGLEKEEGQPHLVMELVDGTTLAQRIASGPLSLTDSIGIFRDVASGLAAAHDRGLVHRDLKPANIMTTPSGGAKVLDFGLAKPGPPVGRDSPADLTGSPTLSADATSPGTLLGTASYMSPEQASGKPVDRRSDVWSWGCCLFEALSGRKAFEGSDLTAILASILRDEPPWEALPTSVPRPILRILERCLAKSPEQRLRDLSDVSLGLQDALLTTNQAAYAAASQNQVGSRWLLSGLSLLAGATLALLAVWSSPSVLETRKDSTAAPSVRAVLNATAPRSAKQRNHSSVSISRDGRRLAITSAGAEGPAIYVRETDHSEWRALTGTEFGMGPVFSPDGNTIAFVSGSGDELSLVPFLGGEVEVAYRDATGLTVQAGWTPSGDALVLTTLAVKKVSQLGRTETLFECPNRTPCMLAGSIVSLSNDRFVACQGTIGAASLRLALFERGAQPSPLLANACHPHLEGNRLFFSRGQELWVSHFDTQKLRVARPVPTGVTADRATGFAVLHWSLAETGTLVFLDREGELDLWRAGPSGELTHRYPVVLEGESDSIEASPNGDVVLVRSQGSVLTLNLGTGETSRPISLRGFASWLDNERYAALDLFGSELIIHDLKGNIIRSLPLGPSAEALRLWAFDIDRKRQVLLLNGLGTVGRRDDALYQASLAGRPHSQALAR